MRPNILPLRARFLWKLMSAVMIAGVGDWLFYQNHLYGGYVGVFALALLGILVAGRPAVRSDRRAWLAIAAAVLFALALLYDASLLAAGLFWIAASMAALIPATARFDDGWRWFQRLLLHWVKASVGPLIDTTRMAKVRAVRRSARRSARWHVHDALRLLAVPVLGSAVTVTLFAAANPLFERLLVAVVLPDLSLSLIVRAIFGGILFTLAWSLLRPRLATWLLPTFDGQGEWALPGVSVASISLSLVAFNLIFALQNLMDIAYLWGWAPLPVGMTMASYAHRGAYPLIATALLAALFVLVTLRPGSVTAQTPAVRRLVLLWIGQNIFLVASSMLRTIDYVDAYSLTRLRIAALAWMALVAFGLVAICWRLLRSRSAGWLINVNVAAAGLMLTAASFVDLGAIAAWWNIGHAREAGGRGAALDLCYLNDLGDSAVLPLLALERMADLRPDFRDRVQFVRAGLYGALEDGQQGGWTWLGQRRLVRARQIMEKMPPVHPKQGERRCDGALVPPPIAAPPPPIEAKGAPALADPVLAGPALTGASGK